MSRRLPLLFACAVTFGCAGDVRFLEPEDSGGNGGGGGDLRADLTVTTVLASRDAAIGEILEWSSGRIEDAEVIIRRLEQSATGHGMIFSRGMYLLTAPVELSQLPVWDATAQALPSSATTAHAHVLQDY
jgi:hypothetical protein